MANEFVQTMADARVDAQSLSDFVFKPSGFKVARRLAPTIDTLQFYISRFNALDGDFKSSVSTAVSSLNNSVAEAEGKVAYIETTVNDAINNTAVEGGVLADTFVTATANTSVGIVARNLRDVRTDSVNLLDFGAKGGGVVNDTAALTLAAKSGKRVFIPAGKYLIDCVGIDCEAKDVNFYGEEGTEIILDKAPTNALFLITNTKKATLEGIKFINNSPTNAPKQLFRVDSSVPSSHDLIRVDNCEFVGAIRLWWGSPSDASATPTFVIDRLEHTNNYIENNVTHHVMLNGTLIRDAYLAHNRVRNLSRSLYSFGTVNGHPNSDYILGVQGTRIVCCDNKVKNDDDFWCDVPSADAPAYDYYCLILAEGYSVDYLRNTFEGVKANGKDLAIYDGYLSCTKVIAKDNLYKNCGNFHLVNTNCAFIKGKRDSSAGRVTTKVWKDNTYIIEPSWVEAIGENRVHHSMHSVGVANAGDVTIKNNLFQFYDIRSPDREFANDFKFEDNSISVYGQSNSLLTSLVRIGALPSGASKASIVNNNVDFGNSLVKATDAVLSVSESLDLFSDYVFQNNKITCNDDSVAVSDMYSVRATNMTVSNNTISSAGKITVGRVCTGINLLGGGNTYRGSSSTVLPAVDLNNSIKALNRVDYRYLLSGALSTNKYFYIAGRLDADILVALPVGKTYFKLSLGMMTSTGEYNAAISYALIKSPLGVVTLSFTQSNSTEYDQILLGSTIASQNIKVVQSGDSTLAPTFNVVNTEYGAYINIATGLPSKSYDINVSITSFSE